MRTGFTTGSCAAAAAKASAMMLLGDNRVCEVKIVTPSGAAFCPEIEDVQIENGRVSCAVRKDAGDDPDVTDGMLIFATAEITADGRGSTYIDGGRGIGRVTRPGLDQPVGNAAINSVPRSMIDAEVRSVMEAHDFHDSIRITIHAPEGEEVAQRTFNPRLGITGGISIIGTTGIVEPMSTKALVDTICVELKQQKEMGARIAVVSPGNYGLEFMKTQYGYDLDRAVKCANYIGDAIDLAAELGFERMLLTGHIGKLIKVSGGIMNTHSREADSRMELMAAAAIKAGAERETLLAILDAVSTEEAYAILVDAGIAKETMLRIMERIDFYLKKRAGRMEIRCMVYANRYGLLGQTKGAEDWIREVVQ
ncbi:MAG: cobalt-precorrin-5B (C(1))-methyltransferase CbiD [Lachnospiraceae bacterium]|nr:cobalt-precorrin-5B (C(1))-methyltransferase CbiD [Lachnospiraceae bacterium]